MTKTLVQFLRGHDTLKADYRRGYSQTTSKTYWQQKLRPIKDIADLQNSLPKADNLCPCSP